MTRRLLAIASLVLPLVAHGAVRAETTSIGMSFLRPEWTVETTRAGRAHVVGYLYNSSIQDAVHVWVRVERLAAGGEVAGTYRGRVVGDVLSRDRLAFDVPVPDASASYRVLVDAVDWVKARDCR